MLPSIGRSGRFCPLLLVALVTTASAEARRLPRGPAHGGAVAPRRGPLVDAHVHLLSATGAVRLRARLGREAFAPEVRDAARVLAMLDSAGTERALLVSDAYELGSPRLRGRGEAVAVRAENDWVVRQAARAPDRLVAFCSVDPLREYALREVARCGAELHARGLKLHLAGSGLDLRRAGDVRRLRAVFATANRYGLALLVHLRTLRPDFGPRDVRIFLEQVLPAAPDVPVQIAHAGGWGGYDAVTDSVLSAFSDALAAGALPRGGGNLYFDLAFVAPPTSAPEPREDGELLRRLRRLGAARLVFGSDWPLGSAREGARELRAALAADPALVDTVFRNLPPYLR